MNGALCLLVWLVLMAEGFALYAMYVFMGWLLKWIEHDGNEAETKAENPDAGEPR